MYAVYICFSLIGRLFCHSYCRVLQFRMILALGNKIDFFAIPVSRRKLPCTLNTLNKARKKQVQSHYKIINSSHYLKHFSESLHFDRRFRAFNRFSAADQAKTYQNACAFLNVDALVWMRLGIMRCKLCYITGVAEENWDVILL